MGFLLLIIIHSDYMDIISVFFTYVHSNIDFVKVLTMIFTVFLPSDKSFVVVISLILNASTTTVYFVNCPWWRELYQQSLSTIIRVLTQTVETIKQSYQKWISISIPIKIDRRASACVWSEMFYLFKRHRNRRERFPLTSFVTSCSNRFREQ